MRWSALSSTVLGLSLALALGLGVSLAENFAGTSKSGQPSEAAAIVGTGDNLDLQTAAFRSAIAVVDTKTTAGVLGTQEFVLNGRQSVTVSPRFSASGANCKFQLVYVSKTKVFGNATDTGINKIKDFSDERTVTAGTIQYEGSYYPAPTEYFDGAGAAAVRVIVTQAPSSGTVTFWVGSK